MNAPTRKEGHVSHLRIVRDDRRHRYELPPAPKPTIGYRAGVTLLGIGIAAAGLAVVLGLTQLVLWAVRS